MIDTHTHLDDEKYEVDLEEVLKNAKDNDVKACIIPGADLNTLNRAYKIANNNENIFFAVGVHPYHIEQYDENFLLTYAKDEKCVAIGECGLDFYRPLEDEKENLKNINLQKEIFIKQINLAKKLKKPLIVHIREASKEALEILSTSGLKKTGGVLHCFNGDEDLLKLAKHNFYFGIGGVLTFKNAKNLVNVLNKIPRDKILLETDSPYLSPHPFRGKRNEPAYLHYIVKKIEEILNIHYEEIVNLSTNNAKSLFKELYQLY